MILLLCLVLAQAGGFPDPENDPDFKDVKTKQGSPREILQDSQQGMRQQIGDAQQRQLEEFEQLSARMAAQYAALQQRLEEQHARFVQRVQQQWSPAGVKESTDKTWVDYGEKADARSQVDFDKGEVEVEVLVPVEQVAPGKAKGAKLTPREQKKLEALAEKKLEEQAQRMLAQREPAGQPQPAEPAPQPIEPSPQPVAPSPEPVAPSPEPAAPAPPVLQDQLRTAAGEPATKDNAKQLIQEQPKQLDPVPVTGDDGKERLRVKVKIPMVPGHLKARAERYAGAVKSQARKLNVDPALVFAVIHTESAFNPMAHSGAGAYGLMQLIPKAAAHEAYKYLYKEEKVVTPEYLYDADHNIELGSAYLQILHTAFFGKLKNAESRQVLSIASYNCGPGRVKKSVINGADVDALTPEQVVALVRQKAPQETKDYVVRVRERMALYGR